VELLKGDKERAKSWLAQSLQRNPNQPEVRQALQALESQ
jgi:hypothetical protein